MSVNKNIVSREELASIFFEGKDTDTFFDIVEGDGASPRFDCLHSFGLGISDGECCIIDQETGNYISWYKLYHFGRDYTTNMNTKEEIVQFAHDFYEEADKEWNK